MNCVFCDIIDKKTPSYRIYEDNDVLVFLDIHPDVNGHLLVVPKKHYVDIMDIDNETMSQIMNAVRLMNQLLKDKLGIDGITLIQNNGSIQDIKHFHMHIKPHYELRKEIKNVGEIYEILKNNA